ncbi:MAG: transcriptional regulator NrdR [Armatimonadota bacterium]
MKCPFCHFRDSKVLDSRIAEEGDTIRRRRLCIKCSRRFTTYERYEATPLMVIKKDKRREPFDRQKVLNGLLKATEKRPISLHKLEQLVEGIERQIRSRSDGEISSIEVGKLVMESLRDLDEVAYIRFASVYKEFKDIDRFIEELENLEMTKQNDVPGKTKFEQARLPLEEEKE